MHKTKKANLLAPRVERPLFVFAHLCTNTILLSSSCCLSQKGKEKITETRKIHCFFVWNWLWNVPRAENGKLQAGLLNHRKTISYLTDAQCCSFRFPSVYIVLHIGCTAHLISVKICCVHIRTLKETPARQMSISLSRVRSTHREKVAKLHRWKVDLLLLCASRRMRSHFSKAGRSITIHLKNK